MRKPLWKSAVFDELHRIRENLTKEIEKIATNLDMSKWKTKDIEKLKKDGYKYKTTPEGYSIICHI